MTAKKPPKVREPKFGEVIQLSKEGWDGVPDSPNPYYLNAGDGLFLHRRSLLGRGIAHVSPPRNWPKFGTQNMSYWWNADPIPAKLMGQVVSFFERIYDKQHTEAAVLLVMNQDTREWRIFVPTQTVNHGGVHYVFDPSHIKLPWVLVGSIHSHCDFGAGHSSTDTHDADGFDGFHATIGMIKRPIPQIVAMVSMAHKMAHYKDELFPHLFDFSEPKEHEAPAWWDRYVEDTKEKVNPVGFELFEKFGKPVPKTKITPVAPKTNFQSDWSWSNAAQRMVHKSWTVAPDGTVTLPHSGTTITKTPAWTGYGGSLHNVTPTKPLGVDEDDWTDFYRLQGMTKPPLGYEHFTPKQLIDNGYVWDASEKTWEYHGNDGDSTLRESREFNARRAAERGAGWGLDGDLLGDATEEDLKEAGLWGLNADHWEEKLPTRIIDALFDSNLLSDDDIDLAVTSPELGADPDFWKEIYMHKVFKATHVLRELGVNVSIGIKSITPAPTTIKRLPANASNITVLPKERN